MLQVYSMEGNKIGNVVKQWSGGVKEIFTEADNFGITCEYVNKLYNNY